VVDGASHRRGRIRGPPLMNLPRDERLCVCVCVWLGVKKRRRRRNRREAELVCVRGSARGRGGAEGGMGGGGNKLSHCRKVCSSKSHLPTCTRAVPEGCRGQRARRPPAERSDRVSAPVNKLAAVTVTDTGDAVPFFFFLL